MNTEGVSSLPLSTAGRQVTTSLLLLLVLVAGLVTYKGTSSLARLSEVQKTGLLNLDVRTIFSPDGSSAHGVLASSARYLIVVGPALIFGVLVAGAVRTFVAPSWLVQAFGGRRVGTNLVAGLSGTPLMLCSCCVAPVFSAVYERTSRIGPALAVSLAAPSLNPAALALTFMLFKPSIATARLLMALVVVFIVPSIVVRAGGRGYAARASGGDRCEEAPSGETRNTLSRFLRSCGHVAIRTLPVILIGIVMSFWLAQRLSLGAFGLRGFGATALVVAGSALAVPVALPTFFEIPLALTLLGAGAPAGVATALLFAGPATNLPSLVTVARTAGWRVAAFIALAVAGVAVCGGLLVT